MTNEQATASRYTMLSLAELEAEQAALEVALQAKRAEDTLQAIDGAEV
jgi:hypothetical protein